MPAVPPGGLPPETTLTPVAFGSLTAAGAAAPFGPVTGNGIVFAWGTWGRSVELLIERSTDSGATWGECQGWRLDPPGPVDYALQYALSHDAPPAGASLYRVSVYASIPSGDPNTAGRPPARLDGLTLNWSIYQ